MLYLLTVLLALPVLVVAVECLLALLPRHQPPPQTVEPPPTVVVLVPAHNEAGSITATLQSILGQLQPTDRLLVVADHCTDGTAEIVIAAGAGVVRHEGERGKGHALNAGLDILQDDPPDFVMILDADCILAPGSFNELVTASHRSGRPVQARYLLDTPPANDILGQVSAFAFLVRNVVRPLGLARLGQPCHLMGTGIVFPWDIIEATPVPTDHLVEDLQMGIDLIRKGKPPLLCSAATVTSQIPPTRLGAQEQRKRWEHGHLRTALHEVPRLLLEALIQFRSDLLVLALDLAVPPLSLLLSSLAAGLLLAAGITLAGGPVMPLYILAFAAALFMLSMLSSWAKFARRSISLAALLKAPAYVLWKLPIYLGFITRPQHSWQHRSEREADT